MTAMGLNFRDCHPQQSLHMVEQIVNEMHTDPSGQYWHMVGTWEEMKWMQEPVSMTGTRGTA